MAKPKNGEPIHPLRRLRDKQGISQGKFGLLIGSTGQVINQIEGGYAPMSSKIFYTVTDMFSLDPIELEKQIKQFQINYRDYLIAGMTNKV